VATGLLAGMRWGESAALEWEDIDWRREEITVRRTVSGDGTIQPPKGGKTRTIKASPALLRALRSHKDSRELEGVVKLKASAEKRAASPLVFVSATGTQVSYTRFLKDFWKPMLKKAGLRYRRYHSLRHTFATWLLSDGAPIQYVQAQLGHATIAQTMDTYAHVQPDRHEHHVAALDRYIR